MLLSKCHKAKPWFSLGVAHGVVLNKGEQGYDIKGLQDELDKLPDSYDEFVKFTKKLLSLKIRNIAITPNIKISR